MKYSLKSYHYNYVFSKHTITWFKDYLSKRLRRTIVNGHASTSKAVKYGVPQGSTLGPTLFILYVNDLFFHFGADESKMLMYADDTVVYTKNGDLSTAIQESQLLFNNIIAWCENNR